MKRATLLSALPIIAQALGRKRGVTVRMEGRHAFTDLQTITLPALPADDRLAAVYANGFIDHESGHIRFTDPTVSKPPGLLGLLFNLLEDIRIEYALGVAYPGSRHNLAALIAALEQQKTSIPVPNAPLVQQVVMGLLAVLRHTLLGQTALDTAAAVMDARLATLLPEALWPTLRDLSLQVGSAHATAESLTLAEAMVQLLTAAAEENEPTAVSPPPCEAGSEADQGADGQRAASKDTSSPDVDDRSLNPGSTTSFTASTLDAGVDVVSALAASGASSPEPSAGAADPKATSGSRGAHEALRTLLATSKPMEAADLGARVAALLDTCATQDASRQVTMANYDPPPPNRNPQSALSAARAATAALRRHLATGVQARCQATTVLAPRGRRLDGANLYRLTTADPRLFRQWIAGEAVNTAVAVLVDRSGSMNDDITLASQAVLALTLALEEIPGVVCQAAAFPGACEVLIPLKRWRERARRVAGRFTLTAQGDTPLAEALWRVAFELTQQPATRRLVVVITDGEPDDVAAVADLLQRCRHDGIDVVGLGIGLRWVRMHAVFGAQNATAIERIEALAPALFSLLAGRLTVAA